MTSRANEVKAGVHTEVGLLLTLGLLLLAHVGFMLVVNELHNGQPRIPVVHVVAEAGRVNDGQFDLELAFFELSLDDFDFGQLVQLFVMALGVVFRG